MKKKLFSILLVFVLAITLVACAGENQTTSGENATDTGQVEKPVETNDEVVSEPTVKDEPEVLPDEEVVHTHDYAEEIVVAATCTESGTTSYTCKCGDTYSEEIEPTGHDWGDYVANGDATYLADGTESAVCASCGETETRTAEGSKLAYTYTDCETVKYAQQTVNVRDLPSTDGNKVGSLSTNQEVKVTGQCNETSWYRIDYNGSEAFVSNKYLGDNKIEVQQSTNGGGSGSGNSGNTTASGVPNALDYPRGVWHDMGTYKFYLEAYGTDKVAHMRSDLYSQGIDTFGFHLNTSEDLWAWVTCPEGKDPALDAFTSANHCNCTDASHNGLYPFRLGN